jgi:RNA polymerase-binding protein DksA
VRPHNNPASRLTAERLATSGRIAELERDFALLVAASENSNADDEHDPEGQTIAYERAQLQAVLDRARRHVADLELAMRRVDEGTYGVCVRCWEPIAPARLEARPTATTCIDCAG